MTFSRRWKRTMQAEEPIVAGATDPVPVIAFTSGKGGSGKTTLAVNFANILAKAGNRILLIDFDLSNRGSTGLFSTWTRKPFKNLSALRVLRGDIASEGSC